MFIYAKQIPPDRALPVDPFEDDMHSSVAVFGNKSFIARVPDFIGTVIHFIEEESLPELIASNTAGETFLMRVAGTAVEKKYVPGFAEKLNSFLSAYDADELDQKSDLDLACEILAVVTEFAGWNHSTLRGSAQREWQNIIYPTALYTDVVIQILGQMYWNECDQWLAISSDTEIDFRDDSADEHPAWDDPDALLINTFSWNDEGIENEIRIEIGAEGDDTVTLLKFKCYRCTPIYDCP